MTTIVPRIIICGAPASGKGTQCEYLKEEFKVVHLSTGDMLRAAVSAGTPLGAEAKEYMDTGRLVPDQTMINIIIARLQEADCVERGWLLDGFPRTGAQADALESAGITCDAFIQLNVADESLVERVVGRRMDPDTGKIYHLKYSPPPADDAELIARLVHRSDDTEEKVKVRIEAYNNNLASIVSKYTRQRIIVDGNRNPNAVWKELKARVSRSFKYQVVFVLGGPGSGKGTVCSRIASDFGYTHLSAGDLLREEQEGGGELGQMIKETITTGALVPASVTVQLLGKAMSTAFKSANSCNKFLIDGFPRNMENADAFYEILGRDCIVDYVLFLDCDEATMKKRLLHRGLTSGRLDDNEATIVKRFRTYNDLTRPVLQSYDRLGKVRRIDATLSPEGVYSQAARVIRALDLLPPYERTFALIKPDAVAKGMIPDIQKAIQAAGLCILSSKIVEMTPEVVDSFYGEHKSKSFYKALKSFMTSGPAMAMILEGNNAVFAWRKLMGPTNTQTAQEQAPNSLRSLYGTDGTKNAVHGSDSERSAMREIDFWMTPGTLGFAVGKGSSEDDVLKIGPSIGGFALQDTFAMIKPGTSEAHYEKIMSLIAGNGFEVVTEMKTRIRMGTAEQFYAEHQDKPFFNTLTEYMSSGPLIALQLRRSQAILAWRYLIGPTNSINARNDRPDSIRALFGIDGTQNACHGSDSPVSAAREMSFYFSFGPQNSLLGSPSGSFGPGSPLSPKKGPSPKKRYAARLHKLPTASKSDLELMKVYAAQEVDPVMTTLLRRLMISRPNDVASFSINYLKEITGAQASDGIKLDPIEGDDNFSIATDIAVCESEI